MYLRSRGWTPARRNGSVVFWNLPAGNDEGEFEILQPLDPQARDYAARVGDAVTTLAIAEDRSELDILRRIADVCVDVHAVRLFPADEPAGTIALEDGVAAYESVRGLVVAAAYPVFANRPRAVQPARKPQGLAAFLRTVRIGPGVEGSYTLTVHTPVPPLLSDQPSLGDRDSAGSADPLERQVTLRMYEAVRAAYQAAESALLASDGLTPFTEAVPLGLSANLCEALAGLGGSAGHPFELTVTLAAVRRHPVRLEPVRFRRDHLPVLKEAADELRARTPDEDVSVTGEVVRLYREGPAAGEITLVGRVEDHEALRRIWIELPAADYRRAMLAHQDMHEVTVRGNLLRRGTRFYLANPAGFRVLATRTTE